MKAFGKLAAALACTTALTGAAHAAPYVRQPGIEVEHYVFNVEVADNSHEVKGETVATVRFKSAGVDKVVLELKAKDAKGLGMTVASVTDRAGQPVKFTHTGEALTLQLGAAAKAGEARDFHIRYSGEPEDGLTFGTTRTGGRAFVTWNWPTKIRNWAPTLDHVSSKVTSEWVVTAPETYSVVANGLMQSEVSLGDGRKTTHWRQSVPISPWLNAFMVARFQVFYGGTERGVPIQLWAPVGDKVDVANGMLVQRRTIDFFSDMIGPYPFEKLAGVAAPMMGGAMEHASVVFYGDGGQRDGKPPMTNRRGNNAEPVAFAAYGVMSHEIAHQWFGDSVTEAGWGDVWLSEGFATYFADLYTEHYEGRDAFVKALKAGRTSAIAAERKEKDPVITPVDNTEGPDLSQVQYAKGGWVLHMLRQQVTTPVFFKGIQLYYSRHHGAHATTDDLRRAMEDASGQDLKWFFDQWLTRLDSPKLDVKWTYDAGAKALKVTVVQQQAGDAYRLPIEIGVAAEPRGALTVLKMDMDKKTQSFSLPLDKAPADVVFDPETKLLSETALAQG